MRRVQFNVRPGGFSLVEVMVAVVVICVGLLGIAKMQALALSNTTTSRLRALAAFEAASLASAMHSNRQYWGGPTPPVITNLNAGAIVSSDGALSGTATGYLGNPLACVGNNSGIPKCAALNLAASDLANWTNDMNALLPNPTASIACPPVIGNVPTSCTIQISWTERAVDLNQQGPAFAAANCTGLAQGQCFERPTYTLYVEP
jgi:type IV pilus assembly protein PilV